MLIGRKSAIRCWLVHAHCIPITCSCSCKSLFSGIINGKLYKIQRETEVRTWTPHHHHTCQEQQHVYFCILCLWFILCEARKASENLTSFWNSLILSNVLCYYWNATDRWFSHTDLIRFNNSIPWVARTIYNYANVFLVFVFNVIQVKHQKIWVSFKQSVILSSGCVYVITQPVGLFTLKLR